MFIPARHFSFMFNHIVVYFGKTPFMLKPYILEQIDFFYVSIIKLGHKEALLCFVASIAASCLLPISTLVTQYIHGLGKASDHKHCAIENCEMSQFRFQSAVGSLLFLRFFLSSHQLLRGIHWHSMTILIDWQMTAC